MIKASELKKEINTEWIENNWETIKSCQSRGRISFLAGRHIINHATLMQFVDELRDNGFGVSFGSNSYGVKTIIITW